jgi:hypothetical protein
MLVAGQPARPADPVGAVSRREVRAVTRAGHVPDAGRRRGTPRVRNQSFGHRRTRTEGASWDTEASVGPAGGSCLPGGGSCSYRRPRRAVAAGAGRGDGCGRSGGRHRALLHADDPVAPSETCVRSAARTTCSARTARGGYGAGVEADASFGFEPGVYPYACVLHPGWSARWSSGMASGCARHDHGRAGDPRGLGGDLGAGGGAGPRREPTAGVGIGAAPGPRSRWVPSACSRPAVLSCAVGAAGRSRDAR